MGVGGFLVPWSGVLVYGGGEPAQLWLQLTHKQQRATH
ncbi:hypothetical protein A33I_18100 [Alkalihalophilus marmarensis DSM 21297]|uniref:Uncharacterized protein n=1 Tax=Alkalihalophilus marmarensis DSM 21297 TaxID=1188261 RepID=U6SN04_9BACI|nr:hypothetical protein A33I_18100 [Alkalihalophilus marmarensis DSM 21297]